MIVSPLSPPLLLVCCPLFDVCLLLPIVCLLCVCLHVDLVVDVFVPPGFGAPRRVSPQGAFWSASQSLLRWPLGTVGQGAGGVVVAAFRVKGGAEAAAAGLVRCHAVLKLQGEGGWRVWVGWVAEGGREKRPIYAPCYPAWVMTRRSVYTPSLCLKSICQGKRKG